MEYSKVKKSINKEYSIGLKTEREILKILNDKKTKVFKMTSQYHTFDYVDEDELIYVELKSRRCTSRTFNTSIISDHKIQVAKKLKKEDKNHKIYFIFKFLDCIKCIKYNRKLFKTFNSKDITRRDRNVTALHIEIPVELMDNLEDVDKF